MLQRAASIQSSGFAMAQLFRPANLKWECPTSNYKRNLSCGLDADSRQTWPACNTFSIQIISNNTFIVEHVLVWGLLGCGGDVKLMLTQSVTNPKLWPTRLQDPVFSFSTKSFHELRWKLNFPEPFIGRDLLRSQKDLKQWLSHATSICQRPTSYNKPSLIRIKR
jgi:hypothetical protein